MNALMLLLTLYWMPAELDRSEVMLTMHERFAYATMMRTAIIHGHFDRAHRYADLLDESLKSADASLVTDQVLAAAREAAQAETISQAAAGIARVGEACGSCHEAREVELAFLGQQALPWGESLLARMGRHIWAADRMWEGLVTHSELTWERGARVLSRDPFFAPDDEMRVPEEKVYELSAIAAEAEAARRWDHRAAVYGRFLSACADCHQTYR